MLKVLSFHSKREGMEMRALIEYYENYHLPLVLSLAWGPIVYKRNYLTRGDDLNREEDTIDFDVITELVFCDRADFLEWRGKLSVEAIGADEAKFLDRSRTRSYVIEEHVTSSEEMEPAARTLADDPRTETGKVRALAA
jgi:EthD domain